MTKKQEHENEIRELLSTYPLADVQFHSDNDFSNGWKLSLQGESIDDVIKLYFILGEYLFGNKITFKMATEKRINHPHPIQSKKCMTIYIPNDMNHLEVAESVYQLLKGLGIGDNIPSPPDYTHHSGNVYYRNDRDESGSYVIPKGTYEN